MLYALIFANNEQGGGKEVKGYTEEEIAIYTVKDNLVHDYNLFYTLEDISNQIISALKEGRYKEIYSLLSSDLAGDISKEQWEELLKNYFTDNFSNITDEDGEEVEYENSKNLLNAYTIDSNTYVLEIKNNRNVRTKIGIQIIDSARYKIIYFEL
ncbi:MAG: hypothetical protein IJ809_03625 [Clostridia bacterium]|nr:hypothetical protein [Clostridia bacterium]